MNSGRGLMKLRKRLGLTQKQVADAVLPQRNSPASRRLLTN
jgi:DNA-binding XRE family transcriptional regulator